MTVVRQHTKTITRTESNPYIDQHLLTLWRKRRAVVKRWKRNKHNSALKERVHRLSHEAQEYADKLDTQNWLQLCKALNGKLHVTRVWQLFRTLLGQQKPKYTVQRLHLAMGGTPDDLTEQIRNTLYPPHNPTPTDIVYPEPATEDEDKGINSDFSPGELYMALHQLTRNTAPGPDKITYAMIRNMPDGKLTQLLDHINQAWRSGEIPHTWKEAHVTLIPKSGKPPNTPANLRPISMTSCVGKVMEKMVLARLEWHLENNGHLPPTMVGFLKHVSTQDVAKRIHEDVYAQPSAAQLRTIVGVDIKKAFDNVLHDAILLSLKTTAPGIRMFNYIKNFLTDRTISSWGQMGTHPALTHFIGGRHRDLYYRLPSSIC